MGAELRPTWVRWRIVALLMAYAGLVHFNRISMSVAGNERIMDDYGIDPTRMGMVYTAYLLIYTLCMTPGGLLIDARGPKLALMVMGFGSAVFVALTGVVGLLGLSPVMLLAALLAIRGLTGMVTAPIHPAAARVVSHWLPWQAHAWGNGLVTGAALLGIASVYYAFGALMDAVGWPCAFMTAAAVTALVALVWTCYAADDPQQHPSLNDAERQMLQEHAMPAQPSAGHQVLAGMGQLFANRSLMLLTISYSAVNYFEYLLFYWMQYYFDKFLELGKEQGRLYSTVATLAMALGIFAGGWVAGRVLHAFGPRLGRALVPVAGMLASAVLLGLGLMTRETVMVVVCFSLALAAVGASEGPFWAMAIALGGKRAGTSAAIVNTGGNLGGLLAPYVTPLFSYYYGWQGGFALACIFCVLGAMLWAGIDPKQRCEE